MWQRASPGITLLLWQQALRLVPHLQAWDNGLKRFLSNQPDSTPQNKNDLELLDANLAKQNYSIVTNYLDGESKPPTGPVVNFYPIVNTFYNLTARSNVTI